MRRAEAFTAPASGLQRAEKSGAAASGSYPRTPGQSTRDLHPNAYPRPGFATQVLRPCPRARRRRCPGPTLI